MLYSTARKTYLTSTEEGFLCQTFSQDHKSAKWFVKRLKADKFRIGSMEYQKSLRCDHNKRLTTSDNILDDFCNWKIVLKTGELCFITLNSRFQLGNWEDKIHLSKEKNKMQVWRIIESGEKNVWISSWVHDSYFLCTDKDGKLFMTNDRFSEGSKWRIENKPKTLIISYHFNTVIDIKYYSGSNFTLNEVEESLNARSGNMYHSSTCSLSSACYNQYSIAPAISSGWLNFSSDCVSHIDKKMGCKWNLRKYGENFCIFSSKRPYSPQDNLMKQTSWQIIKALDGTWFLVSKTGEYLTYNKDGKVFLATELSEEEWNTWCLEPCLPGHPKWHVSHPFCD